MSDPTFQDVVDRLIADPDTSPALKKKLLGSVRFARKLPAYGGRELNQVPAELQAFETLWGRGKVTRVPHGFTSLPQFKRWRNEVLTALRRYWGVEKEKIDTPLEDGWSAVQAVLEAILGPQAIVPVSVLVREARKAGLQPADITFEWLQELIDGAATTGSYQACQKAWRLIEKHRAAMPCPLPDALPFPRLVRTRSQATTVAFPPKLAQLVSTWGDSKLAGQRVGHRQKRRQTVTTKTVTHHLTGISHMYTALVKAGFVTLGDDPELEELARADWLETVLLKELDGSMGWKELAPTTLYAYISSWLLFLKAHGIDVESHRDLVNGFDVFTNIKAMSTARRDWCREFILSPRKQARFFALPAELHTQAAAMIAAYHDLPQVRRAQALNLALSACAAAIWTSLPLRIHTMVKLAVEGPNRDVVLPNRSPDLVLTTPAKHVKNGYRHDGVHLTPKRGGSPRAIVSWFIKEVRPLLLQGMRTDRAAADLLFCGIDEARLRRAWHQSVMAADLDMTPHQVRHAIATVLANEPQADYQMIAALLGDTVGTVQKNYVFIDAMRRHAEGQEALARVQRHALARGFR